MPPLPRAQVPDVKGKQPRTPCLVGGYSLVRDHSNRQATVHHASHRVKLVWFGAGSATDDVTSAFDLASWIEYYVVGWMYRGLNKNIVDLRSKAHEIQVNPGSSFPRDELGGPAPTQAFELQRQSYCR